MTLNCRHTAIFHVQRKENKWTVSRKGGRTKCLHTDTFAICFFSLRETHATKDAGLHAKTHRVLLKELQLMSLARWDAVCHLQLFLLSFFGSDPETVPRAASVVFFFFFLPGSDIKENSRKTVDLTPRNTTHSQSFLSKCTNIDILIDILIFVYIYIIFLKNQPNKTNLQRPDQNFRKKLIPNVISLLPMF